MSLDFVAIDFETANSKRASACSVGLVKVQGGVVTDEYTSLIKPPSGFDEFAWRNTQIHGIHAEHVAGAPDFQKVWSITENFAGGLPLVAHNAAFDLDVVAKSAALFNIKPISRTYFCSLELSKAALDLVAYKLPFVTEMLGLPAFDHHSASDDAKAAALVVTKIATDLGIDSLEELAEHFGLRGGVLSAEGILRLARVRRGSSRDLTNSQRDELSSTIDLDGVDVSNPCWGKKFVFTGTLHSMDRQAAQLIVQELGGDSGSSVAKNTDYLVLGEEDPQAFAEGHSHSRKFEKAQTLKNSGSAIEVIDEEQFLVMVGYE